MGFFSEIVSEARGGPLRQPASPALAVPAAKDGPRTGTPARTPAPAAPAPQPKPEPQPQPGPKPEPEPEPPEQPPAAPERPSEPPAIDLTTDSTSQDDDAGRRAHEAAEARRKAEFDARQAEKKAARQAALDRIKKMNDAALLEAAMDRVSTETEKLTRRNMKEAVAEHIRNKCREDASLAMQVMEPGKSMAHCFRYINRKAREYAEQEMKDQGVERTGTYGCDVPDGIVYQWAEEYFHDEDAKEDHEDDEKFVPKPYVPTSPDRKKTQGKAAKKPAPGKKPKAGKPADAGMDQISLM